MLQKNAAQVGTLSTKLLLDSSVKRFFQETSSEDDDLL